MKFQGWYLILVWVGQGVLGAPQDYGNLRPYLQQTSLVTSVSENVVDLVVVTEVAPKILSAVVDLVTAGNTSDVRGRLTFEGLGSGVRIVGEILGLEAGQHGFHIHTKPTVENACLASEGHFNPFNKNHGDISAQERHVGDLGNILVTGEDPSVYIDFVDNEISLDPYAFNSILNRTLVVHLKPDDLGLGGDEESLKTGNAGARLACGVIHSSEQSSFE